jgi:hypothetical protein
MARIASRRVGPAGSGQAQGLDHDRVALALGAARPSRRPSTGTAREGAPVSGLSRRRGLKTAFSAEGPFDQDPLSRLRSMPLTPVRRDGVSREDAEALREEAVALVSSLLLKAQEAEMELLSLKRQGTAARIDDQELVAAMRRMGPEALASLGAAAVGKVLVEAEEAASTKVAAATSTVRTVLGGAAAALRDAAAELGRGRSPSAAIADAENAILQAVLALERAVPR